jgi:hypothetical protein
MTGQTYRSYPGLLSPSEMYRHRASGGGIVIACNTFEDELFSSRDPFVKWKDQSKSEMMNEDMESCGLAKRGV